MKQRERESKGEGIQCIYNSKVSLSGDVFANLMYSYLCLESM